MADTEVKGKRKGRGKGKRKTPSGTVIPAVDEHVLIWDVDKNRKTAVDEALADVDQPQSGRVAFRSVPVGNAAIFMISGDTGFCIPKTSITNVDVTFKDDKFRAEITYGQSCRWFELAIKDRLKEVMTPARRTEIILEITTRLISHDYSVIIN
jgi:hypothetical protein